ncbi:hypothetical protein M1M87_01715 [Thermodesulfovibrionales bacterium]|nr:hypothetical protein [Thermodesulfovibrionales bacterium]
MAIDKIPIEGFTFEQFKIEKIPALPAYIERDPELVPKSKRKVVINPSRTCIPFGAMYATLGVNRGLALVQGAQGCTTYIRYTFSRIFKEPAVIATTSFHEDAAVFGGRKNLIHGIRNLAVRYKPDVIAIVTTCSSEIIGDDLDSFIKMARKKLIKEIGEEAGNKVRIVPISIPSFAGSHIEGYNRAAKAYLMEFAQEKTTANNKVTIIPGMINPGDSREIKHLLTEMGIEFSFLFDTSKTLDAPLRPPMEFPYYPKGGTTVEAMEDIPNAIATFAFSKHEGTKGAEYLKNKFDIPAYIGPLLMGVHNTDMFLKNLSAATGKKVPESLLDERGMLMDTMADSYNHTMMKKVALFGDPDIVIGATRFVCELGMEPTVVLDGTKSKTFDKDIAEIMEEYSYEPKVFNGGDLFEMDEYLKKNRPDVILGHSKRVDIAKEIDVPFVRFGFPVYDRFGYQKRPVLGYQGAELFLTNIVNAMLDHTYPDDRTHQL